MRIRLLGIMLPIWTAACLAAASAHATCRIFGLPQLSDLPRCDLRADSDGDGIPDWTRELNGRVIETILPLDGDMDGDGIENVLDSFPLRPDAIPPPIDEIPRHLVLSTSVPDHARLNALQQTVFRASGLFVVHHPKVHRADHLEALALVLTEGLPPGAARRLKRLRFIYAQEPYRPRAQAYFVSELKAIVLSTSMHSGRRHLIETMAHELGHAAAFSVLEGKNLRDLAASDGPWAEQMASAGPNPLLMDQVFFRTHPAYHSPRREIRKQVPSTYALANVHEWFAEVFAAWVMGNLSRKGFVEPGARLTPELTGRLDELMKSEPTLTAGESLRSRP